MNPTPDSVARRTPALDRAVYRVVRWFEGGSIEGAWIWMARISVVLTAALLMFAVGAESTPRLQAWQSLMTVMGGQLMFVGAALTQVAPRDLRWYFPAAAVVVALATWCGFDMLWGWFAALPMGLFIGAMACLGSYVHRKRAERESALREQMSGVTAK